MSLYNAIFGVNPLAYVVMAALKTDSNNVPRFRDAYFDADENRLVIYTRTGGGNRDYYESEESCREAYPEYFVGDDKVEHPNGPWNEDLRNLSGYIGDEDDDYDCTYAYFYYDIPTAFVPIFNSLRDIGAGQDINPSERFERLIEDMRNGEINESTERAMAVGQSLLAAINKALDSK